MNIYKHYCSETETKFLNFRTEFDYIRIDEFTELPMVPAFHFWRIVRSSYVNDFIHVQLIKKETELKKKFSLGRLRVFEVPTQVENIVDYSAIHVDNVTSEEIFETACYILHKLSKSYEESDVEQFLGDYPPKSLKGN